MSNTLIEWCNNVASANYKMNGSKINQKDRNALKRELVGVFTQFLQESLESDLITVVETQKGVGIAIDNENIGFIPIEIVPTFKDTDCDIIDLAEEYQEHKKDMQEKAEKKAKQKAEKIAKSKAEREAKAKAKAEKVETESEEDGQEELGELD